jgi:diguanylate cyclase
MLPSIPISQHLLKEDDGIVTFSQDDEICFAEEPFEEESISTQSWKVIIVDDEPDIHRATQLALQNFTFEGKKLTFISAYSGEEGKRSISVDHPDAALILLDVVMETNDAGLKVVQFI